LVQCPANCSSNRLAFTNINALSHSAEPKLGSVSLKSPTASIAPAEQFGYFTGLYLVFNLTVLMLPDFEVTERK
jgi:hypothetical protein